MNELFSLPPLTEFNESINFFLRKISCSRNFDCRRLISLQICSDLKYSWSSMFFPGIILNFTSISLVFQKHGKISKIKIQESFLMFFPPESLKIKRIILFIYKFIIFKFTLENKYPFKMFTFFIKKSSNVLQIITSKLKSLYCMCLQHFYSFD